MLGLKFKRQKVIDGFVVDFFCAELKLILELEGSIHAIAERAAYDDARAAHFQSRGFQVIRLRNECVSESALRKLLKNLACRSPSPQRGEGVRG